MGEDSFSALIQRVGAEINSLVNYASGAVPAAYPYNTLQPRPMVPVPALFDTYNQGTFSGGAGVLIILGIVALVLIWR
jgi:hypothetical protein